MPARDRLHTARSAAHASERRRGNAAPRAVDDAPVKALALDLTAVSQQASALVAALFFANFLIHMNTLYIPPNGSVSAVALLPKARNLNKRKGETAHSGNSFQVTSLEKIGMAFFDLVTELLASAMNARAHGADGGFGDFGDFFVGVALQVG